MKQCFFLLIVVLVMSNVANAQETFSCEPNYFPILCRGKLPVDLYVASSTNRDSAYFRIRMQTHMPTGAGAEGQNLIKGTCAFVDRPVNAQEPETIVISATNHVDYAGVGILERCLSDTRCAARVCVKNSNGVFLGAGLFVVSTFYPAFIR